MDASWRKWHGRPALPTLLLTVAVVAGVTLVWVAALNGSISLTRGLVLNTVLAYLAFTPLHEAAHGNISGGKGNWKGVERVCGWMCSTILLAPYPTFRVMHLQHHARTNDPVYDPDYWVFGSNLFTTILRCATVLPHYYIFFLLRAGGQTRTMQRERRVTCIGLAGILAIIALLVALGRGQEAIMLWALPATMATGLLGLFLDWLPHYPHTNRERYHNTRILLGPGLSVLTMAHNYHLIHHLYPRVPFYAYGKVFDEERHHLTEQGASVLDLVARARSVIGQARHR